MSRFDLDASLERARRRLGETRSSPTRAPRSDRGRSRLAPGALECVGRALSGPERPRMRDLLRDLETCCRRHGLAPPSRATLYKLMATWPTPERRVGDLPPAVRRALYNFTPESLVPEHQIAFHAFNYGDARAVAFAAGLPWLAIYQALRMRGYRRKSRGLARAVARVRRI